MEEFLGPSLPPHSSRTGVETYSGRGSPDSRAIGPALPPRADCESGDVSEGTKATESGGPSSRDDDGNIGNPDSEVADMYGPALPPGLVATPHRRVLGPPLPQGFTPDEGGGSSSSEEEEVLGPLPPSQTPASNSAHIHDALEIRAQALKRKYISEADGSEGDVVRRESWMLELPPDRAKEFGLGPRQFRRREAQDAGDRSVWTDTPQDKATKKQPQESVAKSELQNMATRARDTEMEKLVKKHGRGREKEKSLLEKHQEQLKKKKQKIEDEGKPNERRPFDRNIDLQANRFDEAQKKSIFKKAQLLNDRFARGESKFL